MADVGSLVAGRYWLKQRMVAGGIAEAWRATDQATGHPVAVSLLRAGCEARAERFLAAAEHAARVCHPGIARIHDYGKADSPGSAFLVTELVGGSSVAAVMQAGPLDPAWVLDLICQVSSALGAAHSAGLAHHDISPGTLLLAPGGTVKLTGFELVQGAGSLGSDLSRLGLVAWACLTGSPSVPGASPELAPGQEGSPLLPMPATVPAGVSGLVADLLAAGPEARPVSAAEVVTRSRDLMAVPMGAGQATASRLLSRRAPACPANATITELAQPCEPIASPWLGHPV